MDKKEIKASLKEEKKRLKSDYKKEKKSRRKEYKSSIAAAEDSYLSAMADCAAERGKRVPINPPKRAVLEEIGNSVSHGLGSLFSIFAFILMLLHYDVIRELLGAVVYFAGLFLMFTMSCLYHAFSHGSAVKRLFRRFDYASIYLLIGATFAPVLLSYVGGVFGLVFFIIQWCVIVTGITLVGVFGPARLKFIHMPLYILLGWCALMFLPRMLGDNVWFAFYILLGGIIYSLGIIPFAMKNKVAHFIWHFFVLAGAVVQWVGVYTFIYLR